MTPSGCGIFPRQNNIGDDRRLLPIVSRGGKALLMDCRRCVIARQLPRQLHFIVPNREGGIMAVRRFFSAASGCLVAVCLLTVPLSGCALWHNLQPHRLHRLNRVPPPHLDPEFTRVDSPMSAESMVLRAQNDSPDREGGVR